jgi:endonuclease/exonuclease/phosphatase family metal-dependent hydrolase
MKIGLPRLLVSIIVTLFIQCSPPRGKNEAPEGTVLKIAAYNVEYSKNAPAAEIGLALKPYDFDVVCFSEAPGGDWTKTVGGVMGLDHVVVGKYSTAGHEDKYKTIASRTPLYGYVEVLMADTLHTATKAKTRIDGIEFSIYSVHFPFGWRDQAHIDETTGKISAFVDHLRAKQDNEIPVVMGDFNFVPSSPEEKSMYYEMFLDIGLDVTWKPLGIDFRKRNTYNALKPEDEGSGEVIDHIMYDPQKMQVVDGGIIEMKKPLSDHKPVWALLQVKR